MMFSLDVKAGDKHRSLHVNMQFFMDEVSCTYFYQNENFKLINTGYMDRDKMDEMRAYFNLNILKAPLSIH